ncbi:MAG: O-antigen ligase family protein [Romboutsia timonensis]|uniref:O-antigen ligase family protein n=1 Tax=Romboutsia timonensis TaxID=1776391 RepID=UPI002A75489B|nr:O-antigen ligase family protein [Romboutsia timonensis]MDY3001335.1 O-antigen ligase family protein [Romboutsia timonensis]
MNIFTKKYFIVLFILPFIGINVINDNALLSSASKMVVSIIGYLMLFENFNYNKNILNIKLILLVMLYSFIILFSAAINNNITAGMIYTNFVYIGFIIYINYCMKDFKNFINALNILFTLLIIYNLILAIFFQSSYMYIGYQESQKVFVGTFGSRNGISMVMIPAIAFILIRSEYIYEKVRNKDIILCFMVLIIILLSQSSTGFIVGSLLVIYVLLLKRIKIKININKLMFIYTIIYTQVVIFRIQETVFKDFIENILIKNVTLTGRTLIWDFIMKIIPNSLIFGYGRNDIIAQNSIIRDVTEAHNGLLEILLCTGIIGLFVFILILLNAFRPLNKSKSKISYILSMAIFLYFCIALTESAFTYTKIGFWILIIISFNIEKIIKQKDNLGYQI